MPTYQLWIIASIALVLLIVVILKIRSELRFKKWLRALEHKDLFIAQRAFSKPFVAIIEYLCAKKNSRVIDLYNAYMLALREKFHELPELNTVWRKKQFLEQMGYCAGIRTLVQSMQHFDSSVAEQWNGVTGTALYANVPLEQSFFRHQREHLELLHALQADAVLIKGEGKIAAVEISIQQFIIDSYAAIERENYQCKSCNLMRMFLGDPIIDVLCDKNKAFKETVMAIRKKLAIAPVSLM